MIFSKQKDKQAQIWVETVVYTLIGLAVIGLLLAVSKPKIDAIRDKLLIDQTIESMNNIDAKIYDVQKAPGNKRVIDLQISKGKLVVDALNNKIEWIISSKYQYSEENVEIKLGNINIFTIKGDPWTVKISNDYPVDITYGDLTSKEFEEASVPYKLYIENLGKSSANDKIVVNLGSAEN